MGFKWFSESLKIRGIFKVYYNIIPLLYYKM